MVWKSRVGNLPVVEKSSLEIRPGIAYGIFRVYCICILPYWYTWYIEPVGLRLSATTACSTRSTHIWRIFSWSVETAFSGRISACLNESPSYVVLVCIYTWYQVWIFSCICMFSSFIEIPYCKGCSYHILKYIIFRALNRTDYDTPRTVTTFFSFFLLKHYFFNEIIWIAQRSWHVRTSKVFYIGSLHVHKSKINGIK